jgi:hypothetical protein
MDGGFNVTGTDVDVRRGVVAAVTDRGGGGGGGSGGGGGGTGDAREETDSDN